jgi:hypothetical protein
MSSFSVSRTLRTLGLAAALMSPLVAGSAFADGEYISGPTAYPAWSQSDARTPLAGSNAAQSNSGQSNSGQSWLEQSGATGGGGQHQ